MNDLSLSQKCRRSIYHFSPPSPLPPPGYSIRINEPLFRPRSRFCVRGILRFVVATADTRRHLPILPIRGLDTLGRFVAAAQQLTMGAMPKKLHHSETGRETAVDVAFAFAFAVLLLCLTMLHCHLRGCGEDSRCLLARTTKYKLGNRSKCSLSFLFSYPP